MPSGIYKRTKSSVKKGKTYEELYGIGKANELKQKLHLSGLGKCLSAETKLKIGLDSKTRLRRKWTQEEKDKMSLIKKGSVAWNKNKTYEELLGFERAKIMKEQIRLKRLQQTIPNKDTKIEVALQNELRNRKIPFLTHQPLLNKYQSDILICEFMVDVEADGVYWHNYPYGTAKDKIRDNEVTKAGYTVFRFWENDILSDVKKCIDAVEDYIKLQKDYEIVRATAIINETVETDRNTQSFTKQVK